MAETKQEKKNRLRQIRNFIWLAAIAAIAVFSFLFGQEMTKSWYAKNADQLEQTQKSSGAVEGVRGLKLGGDFTLTRHDGQVVTQADYEGHPKLIFFGFTYCPDICPTELGMITRILNDMPEEKTDDLKVLFVSVDPERDSPEQLREYVGLFHDKIEGLTGTQEQINHMKELYRVYSAKVQTEEMSDYTVDHSAFLYFFDEDDNLLAMYRAGTPEEEVRATLEKHLN